MNLVAMVGGYKDYRGFLNLPQQELEKVSLKGLIDYIAVNYHTSRPLPDIRNGVEIYYDRLYTPQEVATFTELKLSTAKQMCEEGTRGDRKMLGYEAVRISERRSTRRVAKKEDFLGRFYLSEPIYQKLLEFKVLREIKKEGQVYVEDASTFFHTLFPEKFFQKSHRYYTYLMALLDVRSNLDEVISRFNDCDRLYRRFYDWHYQQSDRKSVARLDDSHERRVGIHKEPAPERSNSPLGIGLMQIQIPIMRKRYPSKKRGPFQLWFRFPKLQST